jgi:hypothetical protein
MEVKNIKQENKVGPNIIGEKVEIGKLITINKSDQRKERIAIDDNNSIHNFNLKIYGFLFKKFGFLKTGIGFGVSSLASILYLYQTFYLKLLENTFLTIFSIILLIYSIYFFQYFKNRSCPNCKSKFSLAKKGTFKVGECKVKGVPHDINEQEFECVECKKAFVERYLESHSEY